MTMTEERVLRVLNGRLAGAEHRLHSGKFVRIGHSFDHDVVLRGTATPGVSIELHLMDDMTTIRVVAGQVTLLGRPVSAGEEAHLPFYVPVSIGEYSVAVGDSTSDRWTDANNLMTSMAPTEQAQSGAAASGVAIAAPASAVERAMTRFYPLRERVNFKPNWPTLGIFAALGLLLLAAIGPAYSFMDDQFRGPDQAKSTLVAAGFKGLNVTRNEDTNALIVSGTLRTDKDLARLRSFATVNLPPAMVEVETTESHAAAATEILSAQGIDGKVKPVATAALRVEAEFLPKDRQDELIALFKRDLPAVKRVTFTANEALGERDLQYFFSSGSFGLASFVAGDPSYIVTADGTRWFVGATVPTGHRIIAINDGRIRFEREGRVDELVL
jgi:type III secretion protein D